MRGAKTNSSNNNKTMMRIFSHPCQRNETRLFYNFDPFICASWLRRSIVQGNDNGTMTMTVIVGEEVVCASWQIHTQEHKQTEPCSNHNSSDKRRRVFVKVRRVSVQMRPSIVALLLRPCDFATVRVGAIICVLDGSFYCN